MGMGLFDRFMAWICSKKGHKPNVKNLWAHADAVHSVCKRCHVVFTVGGSRMSDDALS